ncbi:MAG TPA: polyprenol monophosphomannose synthase [Aeromicrobium sp.]|nr:polyprenol monophosphomannose synthase [Aeromicrobium sp.]
MPPSPQALVVIPTYNEADNIEPIVERTLAAVPDAEVLIVDDNSPDGTGVICDQLAELHDEVHVLHRDRKEGLGPAYRAGFDWALAHDYGAVVEMDADGSHQPEQLPRLLQQLDRADVAMGSRWVPGGRVENWPRRRVLLSRVGNLYARLVLGLRLRDITGGFRAFRRDALKQLDHDALDSRGYCFQVDLAQRAADADLSVVEVPIVFRERERGRSKMSVAVIVEAMWRITLWAIARRWPLGTKARRLGVKR